MKTSGVTTFLHSLVVLSFFIFLGLFLIIGNIFAQEAPGVGGGADGFAPTSTEQNQYIIGRFFNDKNGDGVWQSSGQNSEELIYSDPFGRTGCPSYTGPQMSVSGLSITLQSYRPRYSDINLCLTEAEPTTNNIEAPGYAILYGYFDEVLEVQLPSGWHCSNGSSSVCPTQTVQIPPGGKHFLAQPIGIQRNSCTGPMPLTIGNWTDDPIEANVTKIRKIHIDELRSEIDRRRVDAGLGGFPWDNNDLTITPNVTKIQAAHIIDLRTAISQVYDACSQTMSSQWEDSITANVTKIRARHIEQLRQITEQAK
ncbi:hypothetical protein A2641_00615 [Candidatus Nomurabacteria bacterium RIFCSPHIGHO2_01_FULL_37_25]|uniref:Uncharacterized protein n=1 Tax=Candidatus Nomurabacteria bacterium RIFCSPLOWO2_01_FULL_36_16 TaxID=1801767 RepID=A0A1F6WYH3_9BACT|nr:MAG: hypothetical protein A2641_00615 [Candidatus Nomurabacteria bacterium RIFCSPHIGHO2_01_FULL_37_25]OGI75414.1 MAG: hypothetical protein A3D36_01630 [Candidatus Nomurabacteria bacterium RIFCSPHIGHO2_02_FULL_36_29]OGI86913.1 MAG: hypothetical protein A3A91_00815 [Candidatus Nomurabacteria bacterium RIFCSPLOWO2_01_FULL_36_16]OGI96811.1 MAG: hypothetical protein A3I84_00900 [Candidatus Nomurabacteria bacterium RIFCSPLOWO2_02_FULL_36_8]